MFRRSVVAAFAILISAPALAASENGSVAVVATSEIQSSANTSAMMGGVGSAQIPVASSEPSPSPSEGNVQAAR